MAAAQFTVGCRQLQLQLFQHPMLFHFSASGVLIGMAAAKNLPCNRAW